MWVIMVLPGWTGPPYMSVEGLKTLVLVGPRESDVKRYEVERLAQRNMTGQRRGGVRREKLNVEERQ